MHTISTKELRQKLPFVRSELKKGTSFLLIHQSSPIAKIVPIPAEQKIETVDEEFKEWEAAQIADLGDEDDLTPEEVAYYLSLPEYKE